MKKYAWALNWKGLGLILLVLVALLSVSYYGNAIGAQNTEVSETGAPGQVLSSTPTLTAPELDATKQVWLDSEQQQREGAKTKVAENPQPSRLRKPYPTPRPVDTPGRGLRSCMAGDSFFSITSCWGGKLNDEFVYVNAGAIRGEDSQGAIQVFTTTLQGNLHLPILTIDSPAKEGSLNIAYVDLPRITLIAPHSDRSTTRLTFSLQTMLWEDEGTNPCQIYPLAFRGDTFDGMSVRTNDIKKQVPLDINSLTDSPGSGSSGAFAWLANASTVATNSTYSALPVPGESVNYNNPNNMDDQTPSVGDWIQGRQNLSSGSEAKSSYDFLETSGFIVPVPLWDQVSGQGTSRAYHISGFAWVSIRAHTSYPPTDLTVRYWGPAACSD